MVIHTLVNEIIKNVTALFLKTYCLSIDIFRLKLICECRNILKQIYSKVHCTNH